MFKKIFSAAKNLLKSPVGQIGIGLLLPGLAGVQSVGTLGNIARGIGSFAAANPMLTQAGVGLLAGDKPENVLRNVAYGSLARGIGAMGTPEGFMGGVKRGFGIDPTTAQVAGPLSPIPVTQQPGMFMGDPGQAMGDLGIGTQEIFQRAKEPGFLERFGLIKSGEGLGFFEKYSPLLKLGAVGATVAAAAMTPEERELFYDPTKNPYLASGTADKDFFVDINPVYAASMNKGGVMDFPEKDGMINGPGDGQSDDIPAMLSDGEFVMTKQAVMAAGNGDREQGTKKMYEMMYSLQDKAENMGIGKF
jgi:hypothetical protein